VKEGSDGETGAGRVRWPNRWGITFKTVMILLTVVTFTKK